MTVEWRKSSHSGGVQDEACVEVAGLGGGIAVRDSKNPAAGHLTLAPAQFASLCRRAAGPRG
ncbi:DUF397 domain-containing protein [Actinocorallia aurea]